MPSTDDKQRDAAVLAQFRDAISPELLSALQESDCMRFIRARKYDVAKAAEMAENWWKWYHTPIAGQDNVTPANCLRDPYPMEHIRQRLTPHSNVGVDKEGRPIYWEMTGLISTRFAELSKYFSVDELQFLHIRQQELMMKRLEYLSAKSGKSIEKVVCVMNLKDLVYSLDTQALKAFHLTLVIDQNYYPERLQYLFMINAPWFFTATWAMVRTWLDPVTADKIKIVGSDYLSTLREHIPDCEIPPELGGSCQDFTWQYPWPERTGISPSQLGYVDGEPEDDGEGSEIDEDEDDWSFHGSYRQSISQRDRQSKKASITSIDLILGGQFIRRLAKESLFNKSIFYMLFCAICLGVCSVYFFTIWLFMQKYDAVIMVFSMTVQLIVLSWIWTDLLLVNLRKLFELNM
mmetsp:Transcript_1749/g.2739  ORF Transcript_1749/g.2739 Transcript_1749/m.2739 type:complete len:405 (+) Transcript_1749:46-1260(+)